MGYDDEAFDRFLRTDPAAQRALKDAAAERRLRERDGVDRCVECGRERPKWSGVGPVPPPGPWYCLTHRDSKPRAE